MIRDKVWDVSTALHFAQHDNANVIPSIWFCHPNHCFCHPECNWTHTE